MKNQPKKNFNALKIQNRERGSLINDRKILLDAKSRSGLNNMRKV
ncbi:hypothetical protein [Aquimarina litoralis]